MRLIDAEVLKKVIAEVYKAYDGYDPDDLGRFAERVDELIDNAPTVSLQDIYQEGYYDGHLEGYTKAINEEKPTGKWIDVDEDWFDYKCSICSLHSRRYWDYCPNCGAEMRGEKE